MELVDTQDLKSCSHCDCEGSIPSRPTNKGKKMKNEIKIVSLSNLFEATAQEVFNHVANHLLTQMEKSRIGKTGSCVYLHENGNKCAAGSLITAEEFVKYNIKDVNNSPWCTVVGVCNLPDMHSILISQLQSVHDTSQPLEWQAKLNMVAKDNNLEIFEL